MSIRYLQTAKNGSRTDAGSVRKTSKFAENYLDFHCAHDFVLFVVRIELRLFKRTANAPPVEQ